MFAALRLLTARIRAWLQPDVFDSDLNDEWQSHLAMLTDENVRRGMTPGEASRAARLELGGLTSLRESHREVRGLPFLDVALQDLRYAFRTMRRDAGFTTFAVLIVGLGIGASTTVFSVVSALFIRPLPFHEPQQLVWLSNHTGQEGLSGKTVPVNHYLDLRARSASMTDVAAFYAFYGTGDIKLTGTGEPMRLSAVPVSCNFFEVLGVRPQIGRDFQPAECKGRWNAPDVVLLSHRLWMRRFNSDPNIVGRQLTLNESAVTVAGVMPASFDFAAVLAPGTRIDLYFPLPLTGEANRRGNTLSMIGRLNPNATLQGARAEMAILGPQIRQRDPDRVFVPTLTSFEERVSGRLRAPLFVLAAAVGVLMLIVCANLANLLLARTASRRREMAIRAAMGAGRLRLIRQMLTESVVLSLAGAALGAVLAILGARLLSRLDTFQIPLLESVRIDIGVLAFTCLLGVATGIIFGLVPALQIQGHANPHDSLKSGGRGPSAGRRHAWVRDSLVVSEVALACVLLITAGLLIRSFLRLLDVDLGFRPERAAALRVDPGRAYSTRALRNGYYGEVLRRVHQIPGVESAGLSDSLPLGSNRSWSAGAKGRPYSLQQPPPEAFVRIVSDGYLRSMSIPLHLGRDFSERDTQGTEPVIIINETLARTLWPGQNPLGQTLIYTDTDREVIGVVADVRHLGFDENAGCEMYLPIRQTDDYAAVDLVIRTSLPPSELASSVRTALSPLDPNLPANEFRTLQSMVDRAVSPRRFVVFLLAAFSAFALLLASLGIYAVISYTVSQRTQEIGIRMALGMQPQDLQRSILGRTLQLAGTGMAAGVCVSLLVSQALGALLYGTKATDPLTFLSMLSILTAVSLAAGYLPARRASRIDPLSALRAD